MNQPPNYASHGEEKQPKDINGLIIASFKTLINFLVGTVLDFDIV
jgi:hypothetical protein